MFFPSLCIGVSAFLAVGGFLMGDDGVHCDIIAIGPLAKLAKSYRSGCVTSVNKLLLVRGRAIVLASGVGLVVCEPRNV